MVEGLDLLNQLLVKKLSKHSTSTSGRLLFLTFIRPSFLPTKDYIDAISLTRERLFCQDFQTPRCGFKKKTGIHPLLLKLIIKCNENKKINKLLRSMFVEIEFPKHHHAYYFSVLT